MVTWEEVPAIDQNGVITAYEIEYSPLETCDDKPILPMAFNSTDLSMLSTVLANLQEYVKYYINIRAYTSVGPGPYSDMIAERTLEDGWYYV